MITRACAALGRAEKVPFADRGRMGDRDRGRRRKSTRRCSSFGPGDGPQVRRRRLRPGRLRPPRRRSSPRPRARIPMLLHVGDAAEFPRLRVAQRVTLYRSAKPRASATWCSSTAASGRTAGCCHANYGGPADGQGLHVPRHQRRRGDAAGREQLGELRGNTFERSHPAFDVSPQPGRDDRRRQQAGRRDDGAGRGRRDRQGDAVWHDFGVPIELKLGRSRSTARRP